MFWLSPHTHKLEIFFFQLKKKKSNFVALKSIPHFMTGTATVLSQNFDYYNYYVICNCVFDEPEAVIQNGYTYEENGVLYCMSATQKGGYRYSYCLNNPLMLKDPTGQLYTWYVDGDNNVLLNTKDGSNDIVRVANDKINDFKDYAQMYNSGMRDVFDSQGWNDHWKSEFGLASQQLSREQIGILGMLNSDWSRKNSVEFALKSSTGSELKFILSEVVSQWTNPMLVASGLSAGVLGWQAMANRGLPTQNHHFATNKNKAFTPRMEPIAKEFGLELNGAWNKQKMPHLGRHPNSYHEFVLREMQNAQSGANGSQAEFIRLFELYVKEPVIQNPGLLKKSGW